MVGFTSAVDGANYSTYSNNGNGIAIGSGAGSNQYRRIYHSASSGILTFKSSSNSPYLSNAGAWTNASDRAYKENIEDIEYGLSTVEALQPRKFDMIDDGSHEIGFIAQEVEELIPEVVIGEEGTKGVGYGQLTAVLTKAIQELKAELDAAKRKNRTGEFIMAISYTWDVSMVDVYPSHTDEQSPANTESNVIYNVHWRLIGEDDSNNDAEGNPQTVNIYDVVSLDVSDLSSFTDFDSVTHI